MTDSELRQRIETAWEARDTLGSTTQGDIREAVDEALEQLDSGRLRVAEKFGADWFVHQWLKKAVLLSFRLNDMQVIPGGPGGGAWWDKVPSKFEGWGDNRFREA